MSARSPAAYVERGITHIVAANGQTGFIPTYLVQVEVLCVDVEDHPEEDILTHFPRCIKFIDDARRGGGGVLVYCTAGVSRSASVVLAYVMHKRGCSLTAALDLLRSSRRIVKPNEGFMLQLEAFEDALRHGGSRVASCELCLRKKTTKWHTESHPVCIVMDCSSCDLPMVVLRSHDMKVPQEVRDVMLAELSRVADAALGPGQWVVDTVQRTILDHLHWHARPRPAWLQLPAAKL